MRVVEYTGGSTGSSLAMVCALKGYEFHALSSDAFATEKLDTMRAFGADIELLPSDGGKVTAGIVRPLQGARRGADARRRTRSGRISSTIAMCSTVTRTSGASSSRKWARVDAFVAAVGTAGMLVGVSQILKARDRATRVVALEPATSPLLTTGKTGAHGVEGTAAGFWPPHLAKDAFDEARAVDEDEARKMVRRAAREEGIFAGTSTGVNLVGALQLARELGPNKVVATVAVDTGLKYLAGDLYKG